MKKFNSILENSLKSTNLKKVRIKVDPIYAKESNLAEIDGYTGYILAEDEETVTLHVENCEIEIQVIPSACVQPILEPKVEALIIAAVNYLRDLKGDSIAEVGQIINCTSLSDVDVFLQQCGCTIEDILCIYKEALNAI